jgi:hypothetical protein
MGSRIESQWPSLAWPCVLLTKRLTLKLFGTFFSEHDKLLGLYQRIDSAQRHFTIRILTMGEQYVTQERKFDSG